eukprot:Gregarina_sp_Pseudo_9__907@NODE_1581_length_1480_cov_48_485774_g1466_i0_p1_GENE_NODE_1581_length_1480_cov_48_485774_g1466_i0NODE_1581_length_1480_cov_48_485774_g1466_i0_p1_ORF_typecomplete_len353_score44_507TMRDISM_7TM/PF07695_11/0_127TMRDISM_7TM/PF07695_11/1_8e02_NODE_1581_length_1480_cov_48_485774_g1466_i03131371
MFDLPSSPVFSPCVASMPHDIPDTALALYVSNLTPYPPSPGSYDLHPSSSFSVCLASLLLVASVIHCFELAALVLAPHSNVWSFSRLFFHLLAFPAILGIAFQPSFLNPGSADKLFRFSLCLGVSFLAVAVASNVLLVQRQLWTFKCLPEQDCLFTELRCFSDLSACTAVIQLSLSLLWLVIAFILMPGRQEKGRPVSEVQPSPVSRLTSHRSLFAGATPSQIILAVLSPSSPSRPSLPQQVVSNSWGRWFPVVSHCLLLLATLALAFLIIHRQPLVGWVAYAFCTHQSWVFIRPCRRVYTLVVGGAFLCWSAILIGLLWDAGTPHRFLAGEKTVLASLLGFQALAVLRWCI